MTAEVCFFLSESCLLKILTVNNHIKEPKILWIGVLCTREQQNSRSSTEQLINLEGNMAATAFAVWSSVDNSYDCG